MKIDMQGFDLSGFLEAHREATLHALPGIEKNVDLTSTLAQSIMHAHDRATTKCLLAAIQGQQSAPVTSLVVNGGGVAAGSKGARDRAKKAARTRKQNIEKAAIHHSVDQAGPVARLLDTVAPNTDGGGE